MHSISGRGTDKSQGFVAEMSLMVSAAKVCGAANESPSVKRLCLHVADKDFSFKAGQCPRLLEQERMIELAVKYANHPPALWIHNQCTLDSEVAVRVGGEFFFDPQPADASRNLVLIAGGVGINPLLSILRHTADLHRELAHRGSGYEMGTTKLFYSAQNTSELLFKKNILDLVNEFPEKIACSLHVTKQTAQISAELKPYVTEGRITEKEIRDHISQETLFYICGPPPMTDFFSKQLENSHVPKEHICFEKWWRRLLVWDKGPENPKGVHRLRPGHSVTHSVGPKATSLENTEGKGSLGRRKDQFWRHRSPSWDSVPELLGKDSLHLVISVAAGLTIRIQQEEGGGGGGGGGAVALMGISKFTQGRGHQRFRGEGNMRSSDYCKEPWLSNWPQRAQAQGLGLRAEYSRGTGELAP
ncbi:hypothetical protein GH733_002600 [Mirounga leonina]|nr:hypothetical protein GH733_002600 [Mirounga leonina]